MYEHFFIVNVSFNEPEFDFGNMALVDLYIEDMFDIDTVSKQSSLDTHRLHFIRMVTRSHSFIIR